MDEARERLLRLAVDGLMLAAEDAHKEFGLEMPPPSRMAVLWTRALPEMRPGFEAKSEAWLEKHRGLADDAARELFRAQLLPLTRKQFSPPAVAQEEIAQLMVEEAMMGLEELCKKRQVPLPDDGSAREFLLMGIRAALEENGADALIEAYRGLSEEDLRQILREEAESVVQGMFP